jgi:peptidoglycan/LPS O-acetylase OafA/YrhL
MQRIEFANSLRGLAALSVSISHYCFIFWLEPQLASSITGLPAVPVGSNMPSLGSVFVWLWPITPGYFGVGIFFLVSGFVIPFAFTNQTPLQFLTGRILRIWPTYFVGFFAGILFLIFASAAFKTEIPYDSSTILIHSILGLRDILQTKSIDGVIWTLEIEIRFYVLAAIIGTLLAKRSIYSFAVPLALAIGNSTLGNQYHLIFDCSPYLIFMFVGVAFNIYYREGLKIVPTIAISTALLLLSWLTVESRDPAYGTSNYLLAFLVFTGALFVGDKFPRWRVLRFFADISYSLYVCHALIGYSVMAFLTLKAGLSLVLSFWIASTFAIAIASVIHYTVEVPTTRMGKRLSARLFGTTEVSPRVSGALSDTIPAERFNSSVVA